MSLELPREAAEASEWVLSTATADETQIYWRLGRRHAVREVRTSTNELTLYRDFPEGRGMGVAYLVGDGGDGERVRTALTAATLATNPPYHLPEGPAVYPDVALGAARLPERQQLEDWQAGVARRIEASGARAAHLELFSGRHTVRLSASNGRSHAWQGDRLLLDLVVAAGEGDGTVEFRVMRTARLLDRLLPDDVLESAVRAVRDRPRAVLPPTGRMAVVLPASELSTLLSAVTMHTSGQLLVTGMLQKKAGDRLIAAKGDPITIASDPLRPYAVASAPTDASTVPARRLSLLDQGVIAAMHADPQYAAYLDMEPTGPLGTLTWAAGNTPAADLLQQGPVLEVLAFSANMPDPMSGDFASEIKMGYLHHDGKVEPVAQGSVTGNVFEALADTCLSRETEEGDGYFGPARVRFAALQVAGA